MKFFGTSMILVPAAPTTPLQEQCECYKFIRFPTILVPIAVGGGGRRRAYAAGGGRRAAGVGGAMGALPRHTGPENHENL